jgi:asparagine synthase (glutamine-hydrolysing)
MCGIAGWAGAADRGREKAWADAARAALKHRGPDADGAEFLDGAALAHTRLRVIDLTPGGAQPMANETGSVRVVFNGEVYNHAALRAELERKGHRFRGRSDTEVIPHLYEEHGEGFAEKLRGMFALALWDAPARTLLLARDRFGIKPLYYAVDGGRLIFASEIGALFACGLSRRETDWQALSDYLAFFYVPEPATAYKAVRALDAGCLAVWRGDRLEVKPYHRWSVGQGFAGSLEEAAARTGELLDASVAGQLVADVPVGVLLSGGIDSSLVAESARRRSAAPVKAFHARFDDPRYDETWASRLVASAAGLEHAELDVRAGAGDADALEELAAHFGQPFADSSIVPSDAVFAAARRHVTVALTGDGGDEGFGGYDTFRFLRRLAGLRAPGLAFAWRALGAAGSLADFTDLGRRAARFAELARLPEDKLLCRLLSWTGEAERRRLAPELLGDLLPPERLMEPRWDVPAGADRLFARLTELTTRFSLQSDYLRKVDAMSMRHSLEVRVPWLDEDLFAFGLGLPPALLTDGRRAKRVPRLLAERRLPADVARKPKWGFAVPLDRWLASSARDRIAERISDGLAGKRLPLRAEAAAPWLDAFRRGGAAPGVSRDGLFQRVLMLWSLARHLEKP